MADAFNLTAQLNLRGPSNIKTVVADIRRQIGTVNADLKFKIDPTTTRNLAQLNSTLRTFNTTLNSTQTSATNAARAISSLGRAVNNINVKNLPQQINSSANAVNKLASSATNNTKALQTASTEMQEFGKQAYLAVRRFAAFSGVTGVIFSVTGAIQKGVEAFIEYDRQFVKLQQVTGESAAGLQNLSKTITGLATGLGVASSDITEVASTLAQAGLSARDTERALKALALSSLAPSFDDMNETVEGSIALMRQFGINAGQLEGALGSVNAVAAKFAVEASDIITAIQRTGGVFATASKGVSEGTDALNEFVAVFTSVRATTRESAETIATGLRTIFTRIQRGSTIEALKEYGVNLTDLDGKFVGAYKAVELLSQGLNKLDPRDLKFSNIVEELGGFRQIGKVIPLIQQFATAQEALKVAQRGQGSLALDAAKAQDSLSNKIVKVKEEFFALFREIGNSDGFQTLIRGALDLSSALIKIADSIKGVLPALGIFAAFKGVSALTQFTSGFIGSAKVRQKSDGGPIRKFATGGLVPGQGNSDTVPAMLTPGEFVIRKKAVSAIGSQNLHKMNKYASGGPVTVKRLKGSGSRGFGKKTIENYQKDNPNIEDDDYVNTSSTIIRERIPLSVSDFASSLPDVSKKDTLLRKQKSYDAQIGNIAENLLIKKLGVKKYQGLGTKSSNSSNAPIDLIDSENLYEVKFKNETTTDAELYSKLLRYKLEQQPEAILQQFKEKVVNKKDSISLGSIRLLEAGDLRSQVDAEYRPKKPLSKDPRNVKRRDDRYYDRALENAIYSRYSYGGSVDAPLVDDILENAKGSLLPSKVALEKLIQTGYGALDFDRTLKRTTGDAAYARAKTTKEKDAVLSRYFRDRSARLSDAKNSRLTQFGKSLQEAIKNKEIDPNNLSVISKSTRVPGLAEHINQLFGIPTANMIFTSGGSKEPALEAMRTKGPRVNRVFKSLGGFIQKFSVGGGVKDLASMIPSEILAEAKKYGIDVPFATRDILRKRKTLSSTDSLVKQGLLEKLSQARNLMADRAQADSEIASRRKIAVVGITGDRSEKTISTVGASDKSGMSVQGVPATLQTGALPANVAKRVQALIRNNIERLVARVGSEIAKASGSNIKTTRAGIRQISSKDIEDIAGSIFEKSLGVASGNFDPQGKSIDFLSGLSPRVASLLGVDSGVMTDVTNVASFENAKRKVDSGQFDRGRLEARKRFGRSQFNMGGSVQKFASGGEAQEDIFTVGSSRYSIEDMKEAAKRKGITLEKLKELMQERKINPRTGAEGPALEYYDLEKQYGLLSLAAKPPESGLFQKVVASKIEKEDRIATWKQNQGIAVRDYEGRSERAKGFYGARQRRQGFSQGGEAQTPEFYTRGSVRYSIEDMKAAAKRAGITLDELKRLMEERKVNPRTGADGPALEGYDLEKRFGLLSYIPPDTGIFQKVMAARIAKEDSIATWKQKQGIGTGDYEGRSERQKSFLSARKERRGFAFGGSVGKGLGSKIYDLQKGTGLSDREFNELVYFAKTNDFNEQQFKNYLSSHLQNKQRKQTLGTDTEALRRSLLGGATTTSSQMLLAQQLMGTPDAKWNPKYDKARFAVGGSVEDTVPALLTPGEFVINKKAAQRIGTGKLHQLNRADKIQGFNKGGVVQRFAKGGQAVTSFDPASNRATNAASSTAFNPQVSFGAFRSAETGDQKAADMVADAQRKQVNALVKQIRAIDNGVSISDARAAAERRVADAWGGLYKRVKEQDAATASNTKVLGKEIGSFRGAFGGKGPLGAVTSKIADAGEYVGQKGFKGIGKGLLGLANPLNATKNLSSLGRGLSGEKGFYISMGLGALAGQGENIFGKETGRRNSGGMLGASGANAFTAAGLESGTTTLSAGLATASSLAMIPGIGPFAAGLTAAVSVVKAWTSAVEAGKQAAENFATEQRQKSIDDAGDKLGKSLDKFQRSSGGVKEQAEVIKEASSVSKLIADKSSADIGIAQRRKGESLGFNDRLWNQPMSLLPKFLGGTDVVKPKLGADEIRQISEASAKAAEPAADAMRKIIETRIQSGSTIAEISKMPDFKTLTETIASANPEFAVARDNIMAMNDSVLAATGTTKEQLIAQRLSVETNKLMNDTGFKAAQKSKEIADAFDEINRKGRDLAASFDRMVDSFNQALGRATYELEQMDQLSEGKSAALQGNASVLSVSSRDSNILRNPRAYSQAERDASIDRASSMFGKDKQMVKDMLGINAKDFALSMTQAVEKDLKGVKIGEGNANLSLTDAASTARKNLVSQLSGVPEDVRQQILDKFDNIVKSTDKDTEGKNPQEKVNELVRRIEGQLGGAAVEGAAQIQQMALAMLDFKNGALNEFINATNKAAEAQLRAQKATFDAEDIIVKGRDNLNAVLGRSGPTPVDIKARQDARIAQLSGGPTDPIQIRENIQNDIKAQSAKQKELQQNTDPGKEKQLVQDISDLSIKIKKGQEALDQLANSTEVASAALNKIQEIQQAMEGQGDFLDKLATATPEEAEKLGQAFMRLQNNLNGGINTIRNSREAQIAYIKTLRETGNPMMAQRASMGVLAQQRAETMSLFKELIPVFQAQNKSPEQIAEMGARLRQGTYTESGMFNNPMLAPLAKQQVDFTRDPMSDPRIAANAALYNQAINKQAEARFQQGALEVYDAGLIMQDATTRFDTAVTRLQTYLENIRSGERPATAAVPKAKGGPIYASSGALVNFEPKGTDTVPAMLTPGEFVVNAKATSQHLPLLKSINNGEDVSGYSKGGVVYLNKGANVKRRKAYSSRQEMLFYQGSQPSEYQKEYESRFRASRMGKPEGYVPTDEEYLEWYRNYRSEPIEPMTLENSGLLSATAAIQNLEKMLISNGASRKGSFPITFQEHRNNDIASWLSIMGAKPDFYQEGGAVTARDKARQARKEAYQKQQTARRQAFLGRMRPEVAEGFKTEAEKGSRTGFISLTDNTGKFNTEAKIIGEEANFYTIQNKEDGSIVKVPKNRLSKKSVEDIQNNSAVLKSESRERRSLMTINNRTPEQQQRYEQLQQQYETNNPEKAKAREIIRDRAHAASVANIEHKFKDPDRAASSVAGTREKMGTARKYMNEEIEAVRQANKDGNLGMTDQEIVDRAIKNYESGDTLTLYRNPGLNLQDGGWRDLADWNRDGKVDDPSDTPNEMASVESIVSRNQGVASTLNDPNGKYSTPGQMVDFAMEGERKAYWKNKMDDRMAKAEKGFEERTGIKYKTEAEIKAAEVDREQKKAQAAKSQKAFEANQQSRFKETDSFIERAKKAQAERLAKPETKSRPYQDPLKDKWDTILKNKEEKQRQDEAKAKEEAAARQAEQAAANQAKEAQAAKDKQDSLWVNSSNPLTAGLGYLGGLGESAGNIAYGAANVVSGAATVAASPVLGYFAGNSAEEAARGKKLEAQTRMMQEKQASMGVLGPQGTDQQEALSQAQKSDYRGESSTAAAARVGAKAMAQGAYTAVEAAQAVAGQGPIMTGDKTWLNQGDDERVQQAGPYGGATRIAQNIGFTASQGVQVAAGLGMTTGTSIAGKAGKVLGAVDDVLSNPVGAAAKAAKGAKAIATKAPDFVRRVDDKLIRGITGMTPDGYRASQRTRSGALKSDIRARAANRKAEQWIEDTSKDFFRQPGETTTRNYGFSGFSPDNISIPRKNPIDVFGETKINEYNRNRQAYNAQSGASEVGEAPSGITGVGSIGSPYIVPPRAGQVSESINNAPAKKAAQQTADAAAAKKAAQQTADAAAAKKAAQQTADAAAAKKAAQQTADAAAAKKAAQQTADAAAAKKAAQQTADAAAAKKAAQQTADAAAAKKAAQQTADIPMTRDRLVNLLSSNEASVYDILNEQPGATLSIEKIRALQKQYSTFLHPDRAINKDLPKDILNRLNRTLDMSSDPEAMSIYDKALKMGYSHNEIVDAYTTGGSFNTRSLRAAKPNLDPRTLGIKKAQLTPEQEAGIKAAKTKREAKQAQKKSNGGIVYANNGALIAAQNQGSDTVPAMLTPGEFVINRESAQKHMPVLHAINNGYYNRGGMVEYLNNGGVVGPKYYANGGINPVEAARQMSANRGANGVNTSGNSSGTNSAIQQEPEWLSKLDETVNGIKESLGGMYSNLNNVANQLTNVAQELPREMSITSNVNKNVNVNGIAGEWNKYQGDVLKMAGEQASKTIQDDKIALAKWSEGAIPVIG